MSYLIMNAALFIENRTYYALFFLVMLCLCKVTSKIMEIMAAVEDNKQHCIILENTLQTTILTESMKHSKHREEIMTRLNTIDELCQIFNEVQELYATKTCIDIALYNRYNREKIIDVDFSEETAKKSDIVPRTKLTLDEKIELGKFVCLRNLKIHVSPYYKIDDSRPTTILINDITSIIISFCTINENRQLFQTTFHENSNTFTYTVYV